MPLYLFQKYLDPEGYETNQKIKFALVITFVILYAMWKRVVEVQFYFQAETTTASILENGLVRYMDGEESRREKLRVPETVSGSVQIDFLPGVGLARLHGTRNWTPILVLLGSLLVGLILLAPVIREARDFDNGTSRRKRKR